VPHVTLKSIANNAEIDVIWESWQPKIADALARLNAALKGHGTSFKVTIGGRSGKEVDFRAADGATVKLPSGEDAPAGALLDWEVPREPPADWPPATRPLITAFWDARIARQREIDASIAAKAEFEYLYDKPYVDNSRVRVAGPFTVESLSPHRLLAFDADDGLVDPLEASERRRASTDRETAVRDFAQSILENLRTAGVQQAHKEDRIAFTSLTGWPGELVCAEGRYVEGGQWPVAGGRDAPTTDHQPPATEKRAAIMIGPEFGTVARPDLVAAAREAADAGFDVLIACAFSFDAHSAEVEKLGRVRVLKARMNPDLHMATDLKATAAGNLFVIFGEPDIEVVGGRWLVTRGGRMVIAHERLAELPGLGSLEEINRLGGGDLSGFVRLARGGEIRSDEPGPAGGGVGPGEYRGGGGAIGDRGVPPVPEHRERIAGGGGDAAHPGGATGLSGGPHRERAAGTGSRDRPHALRPDEIAALQALTPADFPLALTTDHWSQVTIRGVDVFKPQTGEVVSEGPEGIALWMIDTDYDEESFFVRHAYFLGANDPYKALKTTLKAEIDEEAWATLNSEVSRPFPKPTTGRIAVKVINHLGDEVMKVFGVA
jgi:adenine-specific DNA-methyltransferase